jgi:PAS domain S-box-containing protein
MVAKPAGRFMTVAAVLTASWRAAPLALFLFFAVLLACGLPIATPLGNKTMVYIVGPAFFLAASCVYAVRNARAAENEPERRFWRRLSVSYGAWTLTYLPSFLAPQFGGIDAVRPLVDFGFGIAYVLAMAAFEERPDDRSPVTELGRLPTLGSATLMMAGFFITVVLLPALYNREQSAVYLSSFAFWVAIDLVLALRLGYFAFTTGSRRWRYIYAVLGAAFALMAVVDQATGWLLRHHVPVTSGHVSDALWSLPYAILLFSAAGGLFRFEERRRSQPEPTLSDALASQNLGWALLFPSFHFVADSTGWLDPALGPRRDWVVLVWTGMLMGLAIRRQRQLERGLAGLVHERRDIEGNLRESEQDLRLLVERGRVADRLKAAEERFAKAFEVSPDAILLSIFEDGTILDVNPAFERLSQLSREACVGRRSLELGIWHRPETRERLVQLLARRSQIHDLPAELRQANGQIRLVRASYERLAQEEGDLLLSVLRDVTEEEARAGGRIASLLENCRIPVRLVRQPPDGGDAAPVFANYGARVALRQDPREDFEIRAGSGFRLLLHLKSAESELP